MKKMWRKFHPKGPSRSPSKSTSQRPLNDSNSQARTNDDTVSHATRAASAVASVSIGTPIPSQSEDRQRQPLSPSSSPAAGPSHSPSIPADQDKLNTPGVNISASNENTPGWKTTAYNGLKMGLEVVRESSDVFVPLKSAVGGLSALLKQYDQFIANRDDVQRLIGRVELLIKSLAGPPPENDINEIERRRIMERDFKNVLEMLDPMLNQSKISGFLNNADQAAKITSVVEGIRDAIIDYQTSLQQGLNQNTMTTMDSVLFDKLPRAKGAGYNSGDRKRCLRGTRVKILEAIENWVQDKNSRRVYWLNGVAGTGKTTIAQSFAERMFAEGLLGASFFCSRDFFDRRSLHSIFPTLAFQLAYKYPDFRAHLVQILSANPDVGHESLSNQLNKLLVEPLQSTGLSTVIIIDALDEREDNQPASAILSLLGREIEHIPKVKFFITGRPEPQIGPGFRIPTLHPQTEVFLLHDVDPTDVNEDIKLFLEYHLAELIKNRSDVDVTKPWPVPEDVRIIISKAGGLFIYAATVIKFIASAAHMPQERLWVITSMPDSTFHEGKSEIDPLYTCLLDKGCSHVDDSDLDYFSRLLIVVSSVVLSCEPISITSLATLLGLGSQAILTSIRSFHSVLLVPDSDSKPIRIFHKSFPDYITDNGRCKDSRFFVDSPVHHARITIQCFELMEVKLRKNICNLPRYAMNDDVGDLSVRHQECIGEAVVYACRFWAKHLCWTSQTGDGIAQILELLRRFLECHLLQWLEVLSIAKDMRGAVHSLIDVERWLVSVTVSDESLFNLIRESRRFVLYSFDVIERSAVHIYDSALLWVPTSSLIRTLYHDQLTTQVRVLNGTDTSWDSCIRSIQLGDAEMVLSVAFSHSGNLIVGCNWSDVKVLEAATGVCIATLNGGYTTSVMFSPDDMFLVSGSHDKTVKVWDVQTGAIIRTLAGHADRVWSVAFSPTGTMVASGSGDRTIRIWDVSSWDCHHILEGHSGGVTSVCWLRANEVVSGCHHGMVKVWDMLCGECLQTFDEPSNNIFCIASPPDASKFASGSRREMRVYDTLTGVVETVAAGEAVGSICFSPSGNQIVYGTETLVVVWDLEKKVATFKQQLRSSSVAWSPDGSCIAVGSSDGCIRVFQLGMGTEDVGVHDQHTEVFCVSSSADGRIIASGSEDTVKVWDAVTGSCIHTFRGHKSSVRSVAISPNSSLLASGSIGGTIQIWGLHDYMLITTLNGHGRHVFGIRFSPDGKRLVSVSRSNIILWNVGKWEKLAHVNSFSGRGSRVSLSADGTRVILDSSHATVKGWNILPNAKYSLKDTAGLSSNDISTSHEDIIHPMVLVPIPDIISHKDVGPYRYPMESGWIFDQGNRRVCWIPPDLRGRIDIHGKRVISEAHGRKFVILDLPEVC